MNDSPVVSEPDTHSAVRHPRRTLLRWRAHGAETAAVALGTAAVGMQWARHDPARWLTDDGGIALALARSSDVAGGAPASVAGPAWLQLLTPPVPGTTAGTAAVAAGGWYAGVLALLCFAASLWAATGAVRALCGRRAWPFALGTAAVVALSPPALGWLFSGTGDVLALLALALTVRVAAGAAERGRLAHPRTALTAGLLAGLGTGAMPDGAVLAAVYPATLVWAGRRRGAVPVTLRAAALHTGVWAATCTLLWPAGTVEAGAGATGVQLAGAVAAGALVAGRLPAPARLASAAVGAVLLLPGDGGLPAALALAVCGAVLLAGRARTGRLVGAATLAGAVVALWTAGPGPVHGTVLTAGAAATAALVLLPRPAAPERRGPWTGRNVVVGVALAGSLLAGLAPPSPPRADSALCFTAARYGNLFAGYAELLGLERSTVALASSGGALVLGEQRVLDLHGRTDPHVAAARAAHDDAALRRYLFVRARPEFLHVGAAEAARTGLTAQRLAANGYRPVLRQGEGGDFVHRSAVTTPGALRELRAWARARVTRLGERGCAVPPRETAVAGRPG